MRVWALYAPVGLLWLSWGRFGPSCASPRALCSYSSIPVRPLPIHLLHSQIAIDLIEKAECLVQKFAPEQASWVHSAPDLDAHIADQAVCRMPPASRM